MKILVVGGGGREHAMAWKLAAGRADVDRASVRPGNPGIAGVARCVPADLTQPDELLAIAEREAVDLTVVGPELPLSLGVVDVFAAHGRGHRRSDDARPPRSSRARRSRRTSWRGTACRRLASPVCTTADEALDAIARGELGFPLVVKADGLAAGKGVVIAEDRATAEAAVREAMVDRRFGDAGDRVVLEEFLVGQEASYFVLVGRHDRSCAVVGAGSQAHLRRRPRPEHRRHGRVRAEPAGDAERRARA